MGIDQMKKIFFVYSQSLQPSVCKWVKLAVDSTKIDVNFMDWRDFVNPRSIAEQIYSSINEADLVIFDISDENKDVIYKLGYSHGIRKPTIVISEISFMTSPFDASGTRVLFYDHNQNINHDFIHSLSNSISEALNNPDEYIRSNRSKNDTKKLFISYSHKDKEYLDRLMVHLTPLKRKGLIDPWVDTRLKAGDKWKVEIEEALDQAKVAILLISADFLASDFIVDNELPPILSKASSEGTRIIPIILKPCRFKRDENLSPFLSINEPDAPLATLAHADQEFLYDEASSLVESLLM